jgi:hypothetical protein
LAYPIAGMLALIAMATFSGVAKATKTWPITLPRFPNRSCAR